MVRNHSDEEVQVESRDLAGPNKSFLNPSYLYKVGQPRQMQAFLQFG